jgi:hypothetical protein
MPEQRSTQQLADGTKKEQVGKAARRKLQNLPKTNFLKRGRPLVLFSETRT